MIAKLSHRVEIEVAGHLISSARSTNTSQLSSSRSLARCAHPSGFVLLTMLFLITLISGMGISVISTQRDDLQLLTCYAIKQQLIYQLEQQMDRIAQRVAQATVVFPIHQQLEQHGATLRLDLQHLLDDEEELQVWELRGQAQLGETRVRITQILEHSPASRQMYQQQSPQVSQLAIKAVPAACWLQTSYGSKSIE